MTSEDTLAAWLKTLSRTALTRLLEERDLPASGAPVSGFAVLARQLLGPGSVSRALDRVTLPELVVLAEIAAYAAESHEPVEPAPEGLEPENRAVDRTELLDRIAGGGSEEGEEAARRRAVAEVALDRLADRALLLPPHGDRLTVPSVLHGRSAELQGYGGPVGPLLTDAFKAAEIHRIATGLGLPAERTRDAAQHAIVATLSDAERVRALVADAPADAHDLLADLVPGPPLLATHCFVSEYGYYAGSHAKFHFREQGSGDPGTDWLAERGMLVPVGTDLAELPYEVARVLREAGPHRALPHAPQPVATVPLAPQTLEGQARSAAAAAADRAERLLRALAAEPVAIRKSGGVAVRDTRRLAKAAGLDESEARLWIDLAANAALIGPSEPEGSSKTPTGRGRSRRAAAPPAEPVRLLPTPAWDQWSGADPAARLLPLVAAWVVVPEIFTYWPEASGDTAVALIAPDDPYAVDLRHGLLAALGSLPEGEAPGTAPAGRSVHAPTLDGDTLTDLVVRASWYRPACLSIPDAEDRARAVLGEAELLGLTAHHTLTAAGRAVLALLDAGAARHFPAVPGAGADIGDHPVLADAVGELGRTLAGLLPPPEHTARFQADLTATVSGPAASELAELLAACADRESDGHATVWRIGPASVRRALDAGWDAATLTDRLTAASHGSAALPQPLSYLISDTARVHGRIRVVSSACALRCDDPALTAEIAAARPLAKLGLRALAPTVLISAADAEATLAALRAAGYAPVLEAATGTTVVERAPQERSPAAMPSLSEVHAPYGRGKGPATAHALAAALLSS
ncbi:helicase-associated domain-containing protein [Streptomyces sp. NPDC002795]|uniref:helicase-associated domain-containing protein n=1 Tax=Streptomyces sp. NPDC002795 TaxID=3364665 RepID=UPI003696C4E4